MKSKVLRSACRIALAAVFALVLATGTALGAAGSHGGGNFGGGHFGGGQFGGGHFGAPHGSGTFPGHHGFHHFDHQGFVGGTIIVPYPYDPYGFYGYYPPYDPGYLYSPYCNPYTPYYNPAYC